MCDRKNSENLKLFIDNIDCLVYAINPECFEKYMIRLYEIIGSLSSATNEKIYTAQISAISQIMKEEKGFEKIENESSNFSNFLKNHNNLQKFAESLDGIQAVNNMLKVVNKSSNSTIKLKEIIECKENGISIFTNFINKIISTHQDIGSEISTSIANIFEMITEHFNSETKQNYLDKEAQKFIHNINIPIVAQNLRQEDIKEILTYNYNRIPEETGYTKNTEKFEKFFENFLSIENLQNLSSKGKNGLSIITAMFKGIIRSKNGINLIKSAFYIFPEEDLRPGEKKLQQTNLQDLINIKNGPQIIINMFKEMYYDTKNTENLEEFSEYFLPILNIGKLQLLASKGENGLLAITTIFEKISGYSKYTSDLVASTLNNQTILQDLINTKNGPQIIISMFEGIGNTKNGPKLIKNILENKILFNGNNEIQIISNIFKGIENSKNCSEIIIENGEIINGFLKKKRENIEALSEEKFNEIKNLQERISKRSKMLKALSNVIKDLGNMILQLNTEQKKLQSIFSEENKFVIFEQLAKRSDELEKLQSRKIILQKNIHEKLQNINYNIKIIHFAFGKLNELQQKLENKSKITQNSNISSIPKSQQKQPLEPQQKQAFAPEQPIQENKSELLLSPKEYTMHDLEKVLEEINNEFSIHCQKQKQIFIENINTLTNIESQINTTQLNKQFQSYSCSEDSR